MMAVPACRPRQCNYNVLSMENEAVQGLTSSLEAKSPPACETAQPKEAKPGHFDRRRPCVAGDRFKSDLSQDARAFVLVNSAKCASQRGPAVLPLRLLHTLHGKLKTSPIFSNPSIYQEV